MRCLLTGLFCTLSATTAFAADLPRKAPPAPAAAIAYHWSGLYVGAHVGYGWGESTPTAVTASASFPTGFVFSTREPDGFIGGLQIGFNHQAGPWVFGIEGDWSWTGMKGAASDLSPLNGNTSTVTVEVNWIALLTGRIGCAWRNWLLYLKGGAAWVDDKSHGTIVTPGGVLVAVITGGSTRTGWTIGTGAEWAFGGNWSAKLEYNYIDLGTDTATTNSLLVAAGVVTPLLRSIDTHHNLLKFGLNYRWPVR